MVPPSHYRNDRPIGKFVMLQSQHSNKHLYKINTVRLSDDLMYWYGNWSDDLMYSHSYTENENIIESPELLLSCQPTQSKCRAYGYTSIYIGPPGGQCFISQLPTLSSCTICSLSWFVMPASFYSWLLSKGLVVFVLTVLVTPGLLEDNPGAGPSNEEELKCRKKRLIAICKKCDFRTQTEVRIFYRLWINLDQFYVIIMLLSISFL